MSKIISLKDFVIEQESAQQKGKDMQAKTSAEKEILDINKRISDIDLAIANLAKREQDVSLSKSDPLSQKAKE